ncbi:MAG TPA: hypothetical protein VGO07_03375, partial [Candidatus Saccharimonadales bacterium]|nr:hypothetical protein [Candidatus Saccharimonadales bacterium]
MDNQNQGRTVSDDGVPITPSSTYAGAGLSGLESELLSTDPNSLSQVVQASIPAHRSLTGLWTKMLRRADLVVLALVIIGAGVLVVTSASHKNRDNLRSNTGVATQYSTQKIPLTGFVAGSNGIAFGPSNVVINGSLTLNDGLTVSPSVQPNAPTAGQMYYDQNTNELAYYNGTAFVPLTAQGSVVQNIGGVTGAITLGGGLSVVGNQLIATQAARVSSFGGSTGAITVGNGLSMTGNALQNSGVLNLLPGTDIAVTNNGNGSFTVSNTGAGTGTVTSGGGTSGALALFTSSQNIEDSVISQSGNTVTVTGDLNVVTGGLSLGNALTVSNGGTGATSLAANG